MRAVCPTTLPDALLHGVVIEGLGSNLLRIHGTGGELLHGCTHRILPDMIEVGSFIGMAAITRSSITIKDTAYDELSASSPTLSSASA